MKYRNVNANPHKRKTKDCVVRAIATATGKPWVEVYDDLCRIGREISDMPSDRRVYERLLAQYGWRKCAMPRGADGKRMTLAQFNDAIGGSQTMIVSVILHLAAVVDGELQDTWDCSRKCVGNYWKK